MEHFTSNNDQSKNTTRHENISKNENYSKADSSISHLNFHENKALKDSILSEISIVKAILRKCTFVHKSLINKYENLHDSVSKLKYKVKKLKGKLANYESMERRMIKLEYKLRCLSNDKPLIKHS